MNAFGIIAPGVGLYGAIFTKDLNWFLLAAVGIVELTVSLALMKGGKVDVR